MVIVALLVFIIISYVILSLIAWRKDGKFSLIKVFKIWWNITITRSWDGDTDGDNLYERVIYWSINIPLGFIVIIAFGSL